MRIALGVEYDGADFHGWQRQDHEGVPTLQAAVEEAISLVANQPVEVFCAGRTDTGVHALEQVIHFDTTVERNEHAWIFGANSHLPRSIRVLWAQVVDQTFHARHTAKARRYRYIIYNHALRPCLTRQHVSWHHRRLDESKMAEAANYLIGEHDFSSFRGTDCQSPSPRRIMQELKITRDRDWIFLDVKADSFLHHMVRNIAGVLLEIGDGRRTPEWAKEVLAAKDRKQGGITASPHGLYLVRIDYPENYALPQQNSIIQLIG